MSKLFIELYLDEDVDVLVADLLAARGFVAITTTEAGNKGLSDAEQLVVATTAQQTLLTHNRVDFEELAAEYFDQGKEHYGIIIAVRRPAQELAQRLLVILNNVTADEMKNQVRYI